MSRPLSRLRRGLKPLEKLWMSLARGLGRINTFLLLLLSFYVILLPTSLMRRVFGGSRKASTGWVRRESLAQDHYHKQY